MKMKNILLLFALSLLSIATDLSAAENKELASKIADGNRAFKDGNFQEAEQKYADAQIDAPDNPEANYNAGLACYRLEKYDEAISAFQRAASGASQDLEAKCHYNIGNCLFRQGKLKESLESYKRANELDRDDEDTKANIEYVTRLMKELASQQKDEQEKDPLQKLLRELEALIRAQNLTLLKTVKSLEKSKDIPPDFLSCIMTNQYAHSEKADYLIVGFQALFTNLPPERLQSTGKAPVQQGLEQTPENEALVNLYQAFANVGQGLSQCIKGGVPQTDVFQSLSNRFQEARATAVGLVSENVSPYVNDLAGRCAEVFNNFYDLSVDLSLLDAPALKECADKFNNIGQEIVKELKSRSGQKDEKEGEEKAEGEEEESLPVASAKTLAMKITNAVEFLKLGSAASKAAEEKLRSLITEAPTNQFVALDNFIKARKEFEDDDQKNNEKQQQNQQQQQNDNQNQDQQDNQEQQEQDQKDQQDQDQNQDQNQDQQDQQDQQQNQEQNQEQNQDQQQQQQQPQDQKESEEMTKEQAEQMLRAFEEDNSDKEKNRKKMPGAIVPVDKNW